MSDCKMLVVVGGTEKTNKKNVRRHLTGDNVNTKRNLRNLKPSNTSRNYQKYFEVLEIESGDNTFTPFTVYGDEQWYKINVTELREILFRLAKTTMKNNWEAFIGRNDDTPHDEMLYVSRAVFDAMDDPIEYISQQCQNGIDGTTVRELLDMFNITEDDLNLDIPRERFFDLCLKTRHEGNPYILSTTENIFGGNFDLDLKLGKMRYTSKERFGITGIGLIDVMGAYIPVGFPVSNKSNFFIKHQDDVDEKPTFSNPTGQTFLYKEVKGNVIKGLEGVLEPGKQRAEQPPSMMFSMIFGNSRKESPWVTADVNERLILDGKFFTAEKMGMIETIIDNAAKELGSTLVSLPNKEVGVNGVPDLRTIVPITVGFGVKSKALLITTTDKVKDPTWNKDAINKLVLDERCKSSMIALLNTVPEDIDFIEDKGRNTSFLFIGPPGTGKTLTAEVLAENIRKPLLKLNISDLSSKMEDIEKHLTRYTSIAARWDIPLLIDEADVLIEERNINNLERNGIVATVLQILEYHTSTLFLSSNRVNSIDPAIRSRITFNVHYKTPNMLPIWKDLLVRARMDETEIAKLDTPEVFNSFKEITNGREVKNIISVTMRTCAYNNQKFTIERVLDTLNFMIEIK